MKTTLYFGDWLCDEHFLLTFSTMCVFFLGNSQVVQQ